MSDGTVSRGRSLRAGRKGLAGAAFLGPMPRFRSTWCRGEDPEQGNRNEQQGRYQQQSRPTVPPPQRPSPKPDPAPKSETLLTRALPKREPKPPMSALPADHPQVVARRVAMEDFRRQFGEHGVASAFDHILTQFGLKGKKLGEWTEEHVSCRSAAGSDWGGIAAAGRGRAGAAYRTTTVDAGGVLGRRHPRAAP